MAFDHRFEIAKIVELVIEQVRAGDVGQRGHHRAADERRFFFKLVDQAFDAGTF